MKECFDEQNIQKLQQVATQMPAKEFEEHLKRCIDSGLWVPDGGKKTSDEVTNWSEQSPSSSAAENKETELHHRKPTAS